jgi:hypothetical protein
MLYDYKVENSLLLIVVTYKIEQIFIIQNISIYKDKIEIPN